MSKSVIHVAYDGSGVETGSMDIRELAPALLAINELFEEANLALNGDKSQVKVKVSSDFRKGSFEIVLEVIQSISEQLKNILSSSLSAQDLIKIIGLASSITGVTLIGLIKWLKGRKIKRVVVLENDNFRIEAEGPYEAIEVNDQTVRLFRNKKVRQAVRNMISPLEHEGVDTFIVKEKNQIVEQITKDDVKNFDVPTLADEEILDVTRKGAFNVIGVFFEENLKWRLFDGENRINASIKDASFLEALDRGKVSFTKGDILEVELKTRQWKTEKGLKTEHEVTKVIKQHKAYEQLPLPFVTEEKEQN